MPDIDRIMSAVRDGDHDPGYLPHLVAEVERAWIECRHWRLALQSLTPGGSEFFNDLDRCVDHIRGQLSSGYEAKKDRVRLRRALSVLENDPPIASNNIPLKTATLAAIRDLLKESRP